MYIRFETNLVFRGTSCRKGIFAAMGDLKRMGVMTEEEHQWYVSTAAWFNENLNNPTCFNEPVAEQVRFSAKSWFLNVSSPYLSKSLQVVDLLRKYGIEVYMLESTDPGEVLYRDDLQIVVLS